MMVPSNKVLLVWVCLFVLILNIPVNNFSVMFFVCVDALCTMLLISSIKLTCFCLVCFDSLHPSQHKYGQVRMHSGKPPQLENRIMVQVYVRSITRNAMYQKVPFC